MAKQLADTMEERHYRRMTETPVSKLVIQLGIPTTISMLVTTIYNMADTYFVGQLNDNRATGGVGVVYGLMSIIQAIGFMYGHGGGSLISRALGQREKERATRLASTSFFYALMSGLAFSVLGLLFQEPLMKLLGSTDTILPFAKEYSLYILLAAPFMMGSFVLNNILRYEGRASIAMIGLTTGGILNIFLDWLFLMYLDMGVGGAGLATGISQMVSFTILLSMFLTGRTQSKLAVSQITRKFGEVMLICKTGLPSFLRQGLGSIGTMMLNHQAGVYGAAIAAQYAIKAADASDAAVAAMSVVNRICFFIFAVGLGIGQGFQPVCAFNYGAKKYARVRKAFSFTFTLGEIFMGSLAIIGMIFSGSLIGIFRDAPEVIDIGTYALRIQLAALFFQPLCVFANMLFQTVGKHNAASFLSALRSGLLLVPLLIVLPLFFELKGVQMAQGVADVIAFFIALPFVIHFFRVLPKEDDVEWENA